MSDLCLLHGLEVRSLLLLSSVVFSDYSVLYFSILVLMNIRIVSSFKLL